jgi:hypothetical protein
MMMKKLLLSLLVMFTLIQPVHASEVELDKTTVDAVISQDGSVRISETWQINFDGTLRDMKESFL